MSYRGRPSKGCIRCKSRKVKCDQATPACQRCAKGGLECIYEDHFALVFRNQTHAAGENAQKNWRRRAKNARSLETAPTVDEAKPQKLTRREVNRIPQPPLQKGVSLLPQLDALSQARFVYDWVGGPKTDSNNVSLAVFPSADRMHGESCYPYAFVAAAYANFGRRFRSEEAKLLALEHYGKALLALADMVSSPSVGESSQLIFGAIALLGFYELASSPAISGDGSFSAHARGASALLARVGVHSGSPNGLYETIFLHDLTDAIVKGRAPTTRLPKEFCEPSPGQNPIIPYMLVPMQDAALYQAEWIRLYNHHLRTSSLDDERIYRLVERMGALERKLARWTYDLKPPPVAKRKQDWAQKVAWLQTLQNHPSSPSILYSFATIPSAAMWIQYQGIRLMLCDKILRTAALQAGGSPLPSRGLASSSTQDILSHVIDAVDRLCGCVYSMLAELIPGKAHPEAPEDIPARRGYYLMWSLYQAAACLRQTHAAGANKGESESKADWIKRLLVFIRDDLGAAKAGGFLKALEDGDDLHFGY